MPADDALSNLLNWIMGDRKTRTLIKQHQRWHAGRAPGADVSDEARALEPPSTEGGG